MSQSNTPRDAQRVAEGYYLPYQRTVHFYVNGSYRSTGKLCAKEPRNIQEGVDLMKKQSAQKWGVSVESITAEY